MIDNWRKQVQKSRVQSSNQSKNTKKSEEKSELNIRSQLDSKKEGQESPNLSSFKGEED